MELKEKVVMFTIYKQDGIITTEVPPENGVKDYELFGFLKCFLKGLEEDLIEGIEKRDDEE